MIRVWSLNSGMQALYEKTEFINFVEIVKKFNYNLLQL
jgi:hypothetical protein